MDLISYLSLYLPTVLVLVALDLLWLGVAAKSFYRTRLGHMLGPVNWGAASIFYLMYSAGILFFAVRPALLAGSLTQAILWGGAFGLCAYGTYDLTNRATLKGWPISVTVIDIIWGAALTAILAALGYSLGMSLL